MRILEVSRYKNNFADHQLPFVSEQGEAIRALGHEVDYFLVKGNYIKAVGALKHKIREFKPDIVHAHFGLSAITAELQSLVPPMRRGIKHGWQRRLIVPNSSLGSLNNTQVQWMRFVQRHQIGGVGSSNSQRVQVQLVPFSFYLKN